MVRRRNKKRDKNMYVWKCHYKGPEEMAHLVKCFPCKPTDPSSDS